MRKMDRRDFLVTTGALGALASATTPADARAPSAPVVARKSLRSIFFIGYLRVPGGYARAPGIVNRLVSPHAW